MSTTPPEQPSDRPRARMPMPGMTTDYARLPWPGNAEFAVYVIALILAMIVVWIADTLGIASWFDFFKWATAAYLLSRGIAKASRVLEQ